MADRIEVAKATEFVVFGPPKDTLDVAKLVMYVILEPGSDTSEPERQAHVYTQKITRA